MSITLWVLVFVVSLIVLVKGADIFLTSAEKIGLSMGISPFIIGVTIVAAGTSFPELISSFVAIYKGTAELVVANAIGSNIANIFLIVGLIAIFAKRITIKKDLIDLDLPLLAISMLLLIGVAYDSVITKPESIILFVNFIFYLIYASRDNKNEISALAESAQETHQKGMKLLKKAISGLIPRVSFTDALLLALGGIMLAFGANYLIESVISISTILNVGVSVIGITAVAIGTSLPELFVSIRGVMKGKPDIVIGNILGSNIFNTFIVIGLPGLFSHLPIDHNTLFLGLPAMIIATIIFVISGTSKTIYFWEGVGYISLYTIFIAKLFNLF